MSDRPEGPTVPPAPDAPAPEDAVALRRLLDEKLRQLIQRQRDVHTLTRKLGVASQWYEAGAKLAARVAELPDRTAALGEVADTFAEEFGFEFVRVSWGDAVEQRPTRVPPEIQVDMIDAADRAADGPVAQHRTPSGAVRDTIRLEIRSKARPAQLVVVVLARTERTAANAVELDHPARMRLANLADILASAFDAVELRAALVHERDSLALAVADATADLRTTAAVAVRARAEAERSATARSEFLANMSHEIRTPMTAILGYAELLLDADVTTDVRQRYVDTIVRSGRHLLQLLDDILDLARLESGRATVAPEPVSVPALLHDVQSLLAVRAADRQLELAVRFATPLPDRLILDGNRLRQILINLVGNALKFTDHGSVVIEAGYQDGHLTVCVIDTGIGMPADRIDTMFEPFEQIEQASQRRTGTGLGLAISRRLAQLMDGTLAAESEVGVGSVFTFAGPATVVEGATLVSTPATGPAPAPAVAPTTALRGRVLVADDTAANRAVFAAMIGRVGLEIELAEDGRQAVERVEAAARDGRPYDAVLLDMQMPIMDGYEATHRLRQRFADLPIIAITAHAMAGDRDACIAAGCTDYLAKPVRRDALYATLARYTQVAHPMTNVPAVPPHIVSEFADDDIISELLPEFVEDVRAQEVELAAASAAGDRIRLKALSHRLKGSSSTFGFPTLAALASAAERAAADAQLTLEQARAAVAALITEARRVTL